MRRVVITGTGIYSSLGQNLEEVKSSLEKGKSGIVFDQERKDLGYRSALVGMVEIPNLKKELGRRARIGMPEQAKFAYVSTKEALDIAGISEDYLEKNEIGIIFGNDSCAGPTVESTDIVREKRDTTLVGSGAIFQTMNSTVSMNLSTVFKLKGINLTLSAACASGSHSIGMAYLMIKNGLQDMIICGGAQEINKYAFGTFDGLGVFSDLESDPMKASRPFDRDRNGLVPGGGAATVIIESLESAQKRGANILGEIVGYGFSSNGEHISNPSKDGQIRALNMALNMGKMDPSKVDYVNAHATSTPMGDSVEAQAIYEVFGGETPVSSTKSMTGHECWMAGASEIVYSMLMMENGFIAPNINFKNPDEFSEKLTIIAEPTKSDINCFASNSFGFGGTNSTLVVKKYEE